MKVFILFAMVLCIRTLAWCAASVPPSPGAERAAEAVTDPYVWDFGTAKAGDVLEHQFMFTNSFGKDMRIKETTTSCGCTVSEIKKKDLKPGESTVLSVRFNTKGYSGDTRQFVYVNTDNADEPVIRFTIRGNISK